MTSGRRHGLRERVESEQLEKPLVSIQANPVMLGTKV